MPFSNKKGMTAFFGGLLQSVGQQKLQNYLTKQQEQMQIAGEKRKEEATNRATENKLAIEKMNDPMTTAREKLAYRDILKRNTGRTLPIGPSPAPEISMAGGGDSAAGESKLLTSAANAQRALAQGQAATALTNERNARTRKILDDMRRSAKDDKLKYKIQFLNNEFDNQILRQKNSMDAFGDVSNPDTYNQASTRLKEIEDQAVELQKEIFPENKPAATPAPVPAPAPDPFKTFGGRKLK